ncbi:cryptochrome/photolyase family protein [Gilvimarinus agarilyticus]|uniref:cryptochrome/photolyase family protein n=1 Tax=Gilvimarinus agarilyticus TaxID=679259 RepID=UPI001E37DBB3|nr:FAD-binding domain-containing protein [Gilvimarinus agarilyticus]
MWFRNDLRVTDNPALYHGLKSCTGDLIGCYILCEQYIAEHPINARQLWFIQQHLQLLQQAFRNSGRTFTVIRVKRASDIPAALRKLSKQESIGKLVFNAEYPLNELRRDRATVALLESEGISCKRYHDRPLVPPGMVTTAQGTPYKVYTPFARAWRNQINNVALTCYQTDIQPVPPPVQLEKSQQAQINKVFKGCWGSREKESMAPLWPVGELAADARLTSFCQKNMGAYQQQRDFPAAAGTSALSPYLAIGVLSPKQCFIAARDASGVNWQDDEGAACWIGELIWRDFYMHIIAAFPALSRHKPMQHYTEGFAWRTDQNDFTRWCKGQTGIPIIDAAMRQLNQTGWMHNRLRMVSAMFLTKNLRIDWRWGERYFMEQLIDADFCSNNGGWQWSASTGTDAAPYFRIMNPQTQSERFDPTGHFIRRFVPELEHLEGKKIHKPADNASEYPQPMVDLKASRAETIEMFKALK